MKILIISYHHSDENSTGSRRSRALGKYLPKFGIPASVLTYSEQQTESSFDEAAIIIANNTPHFNPPAWQAQSIECGAKI